MLKRSSRLKVLNIFFDSPTKEFQIRQISRKIRLAPTSVKKYLNEFVKERLALKINKGIYASYMANREDENFRLYKKINAVISISSSGLLEYLIKKTMPDSIILFGSASRGEDIETSDIDIFIQAEEADLNLKKFEKRLKRKITIFFEPNFNKLSKELKNNILNGVVLSGYIRVF